MRLTLSLVFVLLFASLTAQAKDTIQADPTQFASQRAEIEKSIQGDKYSELTRTQREEVMAALDRMETILASADSVKNLEEGKQIELYNDQELINNLLTQAREDSRMICRQRIRTGSHRANTECRTVAEIRRDRESTQQAMRDHQRSKLPVIETGAGPINLHSVD